MLVAHPSGSEPPECPTKVPQWFVHAREQLIMVDLGPHFHAALTAWTRLEEACKFQTPTHSLLTTSRPDIVTKWIIGARGQKQPARPVTNPQAFTKSWWWWWAAMQPDWRLKDDNGRWVITEEYGGEWDDKLLHWGPNGLLSVVAGLYFWGCGIVDQPGLHDDWESAVLDVCWILEGLASFHEKFKRR
ncbi:hypothetical protein B0H14DRAFT_2351747 [Mycena olivaceomarginata]|nr:hypothetical protein B0H14DRAFT_2351747 [Mycena olivaceomarginata]